MRTEGFRCALLATLIIASLMALAISLFSASLVSAEGTPRAPIYINGNAGFTAANGVVGGSGTAADPYIIENWDISAGSANGIEIRNTTAHFIIRNCYVHDGGSNYDGISFYNVTNGVVDNNLVENNHHGIYMGYSDNNTIKNCTVENHYIIEYSFGIFLNNSWNNTISNNTVENNGYDGIHLYYSDNNLVSNNIVENNGWDGIDLVHSDNNLIDNNLAGSNSYDGVHLYYSINNLITNCTVENNNELGILLDYSDNNLISNNLVRNSVYAGIRLDDSSSNTISNNTAENNRFGIFLWDWDNYNLISNNLVRNSVYAGIRLDNSSNNTISNNIAENSQNNHGILLWNSDNNTLSSNTCSNNPYHGICLDSSDNNLISNNLARNNGYAGMKLYYSENNLISNNFMEGNVWDGIYLYYSGNITIDNNVAKGNSMSGIFLNRSDNNLISNNILKNNTQEGIYLYYSGTNNLISNNLAVRNGTGIYIKNFSDNNRIFHNNFVNNATQAYDPCSNYWDDGYPSGGNYWSDYTGADNYQGENQDILGSDGIGDTPYNIPAESNQDRYPIMSPFPFRDVGVEISPIYRESPVKATLTYIVTVNNIGTENDNYGLTVSDDAGWGPTLSDYLLEIPAGENRQTTLSVTVPENTPPCIEDTITVVATSQADNRIKDVSSCKAHAVSPKAEFSSVTLYKVNLDLNLYLENGSKLVVKFYTWGDVYQGENVVWTGATPDNVSFSKIVPHPENKAVEKVRLDLTYDNTENVISTLSTFIAGRGRLMDRVFGISMEYPSATPEQRQALMDEVFDISMMYPSAPP